MIFVAGGVRKSPGKDEEVKRSVQAQKEAIEEHCKRKFKDQEYYIDWFIDENVSGDDPNRPELKKVFDQLNHYNYCIFHVVDRYARSYLGIKWFMLYFTSDEGKSPHLGCRLEFVEGTMDLYTKDGRVNEEAFLQFFLSCGISQYELMKIRNRQKKSLMRLRKDTVTWNKKYQGRKPGAKGKKKKRK